MLLVYAFDLERRRNGVAEALTEMYLKSMRALSRVVSSSSSVWPLLPALNSTSTYLAISSAGLQSTNFGEIHSKVSITTVFATNEIYRLYKRL